MVSRKTKLTAVAVATLSAMVFSVAADAKISANKLVANKLVANKLVANTQSDKAKFDLRAVRVGQITLADGTILTAQ
jgi:hypothetical protein